MLQTLMVAIALPDLLNLHISCFGV